MSKEVLWVLSGTRLSHVVAEQIKFSDAEVPCKVNQLESGVAAEVDVVRCFANTVPRSTRYAFNFVRMLTANFFILRPDFTVRVMQHIKIRRKPARITEINDIQKIAKLIRIIETEKNHASAFV